MAPTVSASETVPLPASGKSRAESPSSVLVEEIPLDSLAMLDGGLITEEMAEEERKLAQEREEQRRAEEAAAAAQAPEMNSPLFSKLENLLRKTAAYSNFLTENMNDIQLEHLDAAGSPAMADGKAEDDLSHSKSKRKQPTGKRGSHSRKSARTEAGPTSPGAGSPNGKDGDAEREDESPQQEEARRRKLQEDLVPLFTGGLLKDYQLKGVNWMISLWQNGLNGILADQMGLGKTVQSIALLAHLRSKGMYGPFLVVAPLSTVGNWVSEFTTFTPSIPVLLYHGNKDERPMLRATRMPRKIDENFPIIITSYEVAMNDRKYLQGYAWKYMIVDEGHRLKNFDCRLIRELRRMPADNTLLLTGTPLQNNLIELWSLLNFLLPDVFNSVAEFSSWFDFAGSSKSQDQAEVDKERRAQVVTELHKILKPFLLRRLKEDVEKSLPKKKEIVLYARMSPQQQEFDQHLVNKTLTELLAKDAIGSLSKSKLNNVLMQLRKNCNHPDLITSQFTDDMNYPPVDTLIEQCGKLRLLDRLITRLKAQGHKVLIFSQMTKLLDLLEYYLQERGFNPFRIDGSVAQDERQKQIKEFNSNPEVFVFLLSTRAGGLGINLVSADTVIIYDSDWNPHQDMQAMDRVHRIGQKKPVHVYRLITSHSVECKMLKVANDKLKMEHLVITKGNFNHDKEHAAQDKPLHEMDLVSILRPERDETEELVQSEDISDEDLALLLDRTDMLQTPEGAKARADRPLRGPGYEVVIPGGSRANVLSSIQ